MTADAKRLSGKAQGRHKRLASIRAQSTLGIACVSTNRSDLQGRLFPQTTLHDSWDLDGAFTLCQRLTEDEGFYQAVTSEAVRNVEEYDHTQFQDRFQSLVAQHTLSVSTETV